jgi:hypothetical protein
MRVCSLIEQTFDIEIALDHFVSAISDVARGSLDRGRVIRDVFGRLSFASCDEILPNDAKRIIDNLLPEIGSFLAPQPILQSGSPLLASVLTENGILRVSKISSIRYRLIDRRLAGEEWMQKPSGIVPQVPRFAFYGLKGGVGRSTALAVSAADLARHGLNVLVVDLDLEAPGLDSLLLNVDQQPEYGVLDWLAAGSVGADLTDLAPNMVGGSPFTSNAGVIDVVPASGKSTKREPTGFLSKLARAYTPGAANGRLVQLSFTEKIELLLGDLIALRRYDAVLLDVRAGLHETSAASLLGLGATCFLFGSNSVQTSAGYNILLATVRQTMETWPDAPELRDRFRMVHGRATAALNDRLEFRAACWQLWLDNLYDSVEVDSDSSTFSFDLDDTDGPHFPWTILGSDYYSAFDPQKDPEYLREANYLPVFESFVSSFRSLVMSQDRK